VFQSAYMKPSLTLLVLLALSTACQAINAGSASRTAPFRARPDATVPGKLVGPFSGQVNDAATGDPVAGALVYGTWTYQAGNTAGQPAGFREAVASTDANGRYLIARPKNAPKGKLINFHLVIYKRGYVAYRSDRRFADLGPKLDFAQRNNEVVLERWHSDLSHARHLRYVGGGAPIAALSAWEQEEAAAELSGSRAAGAGISSDLMSSLADDRLIAAQLLGGEEIKSITGFDGTFESGPLNDEPGTDTYSSQHFKALGQPEVFDVALRLWRLDAEAAQKRFSELQDTLPGVSERSDVADRSLLAVEGDIQGYAFMDGKRGLVILITCGKGQCREIDQLVDIARKVHQNIEAVVPLRRR
jgi:hypothetical protein